jgi:hypothetical protein
MLLFCYPKIGIAKENYIEMGTGKILSISNKGLEIE